MARISRIKNFLIRALREIRVGFFGRYFYRVYDVLVAGAAAEVAGKSLPDFGFRRVGILFQEGNQGHQKAGRAETALQAVGFVEGLLQWMQIVRRAQAFYRLYIVAVGLDGQHEAGAYRHPIKYDRTRAAHAMFAANVRAGQTQFVAQKVTEQQAWFDFSGVGGFINGKSDGVFVHKFFAANSPEFPRIRDRVRVNSR
jgi:hypothetical protein